MGVEAPTQQIRPDAFHLGLEFTEAELDAVANLQKGIDNGQLTRIGKAVVDTRIHRNTSNVLRDLDPRSLGSAVILGSDTKLRIGADSKLSIGNGSLIIDSHVESSYLSRAVVVGSRIKHASVSQSSVLDSQITDGILDRACVNRVGIHSGTQIYGSEVSHGTIFDAAIDDGSLVRWSHVRDSVVTASALDYVSATESLIYSSELAGTEHRSLVINGEQVRDGRRQHRMKQGAGSSSRM